VKLRRDTRGPGPYLEWRVRLLGAGAILALAGIWADVGWLVNVAIAFLFVGFLLRFAGGWSDDPDPSDPDALDDPE
jgi:hypothetical protein